MQTLRIVYPPQLFPVIRVGAVLVEPSRPTEGYIVAKIDTNGATMECGDYLTAARINQLSMAVNGPKEAA
jgi:hypothetical protein